MQQIRSTNTKPEMLVRKFLFANGYRYTLHGLTPGPSPYGEGKRKRLPGKPDIVLPKHRTIIFVHACLPVGRAVSGMDTLTANTTKYHKPVPAGG
jgi:DNA mismatch endonuclease, patch repair protein